MTIWKFCTFGRKRLRNRLRGGTLCDITKGKQKNNIIVVTLLKGKVQHPRD